jgi:hypothetical protein
MLYEAIMIDRQNGDLVFECDTCGETFESETSDFNSAWNQAKRDGWRVKKIGTQWVHSCPNCH